MPANQVSGSPIKFFFEKMAKNLQIPIFCLFFVIKDPLKNLDEKNQNSASTTFWVILLHIHAQYWKDRMKLREPIRFQQGKSEGFESCDRPIVRKRTIWVKIGDVLSRVTLKFDG